MSLNKFMNLKKSMKMINFMNLKSLHITIENHEIDNFIKNSLWFRKKIAKNSQNLRKGS